MSDDSELTPRGDEDEGANEEFAVEEQGSALGGDLGTDKNVYPTGVMRDLRMLDGAAFDACLPRLDAAEGAWIQAEEALAEVQ